MKPQDKTNLKSPTSLKEIRKEVLDYHTKMNSVIDFLKTNGAPPEAQLDKGIQFMEFYIEKEDLLRLNSIAALPEFQSFTAFFGLTTQGSITACFLGTDKDRKILDRHKPSKAGAAAMAGEDTWIPPKGSKAYPTDFTLETSKTTIETFLAD